MTANNHFLEIPVYRSTWNAHTEAMNRKRDAYCAGAGGGLSLETRKRVEQHFDEQKWSCWEYNDVIGWLRVFWLDWQLRGEYHWVREKRILLGGQRRFQWFGKAFEAFVYEDATSADIFALLQRLIAEWSREAPVRGRHVDTRALERIGPHIDWRSFIEHESKRPNREKLGY
jgi:hypothetical protein